jgi:hypothetical protein
VEYQKNMKEAAAGHFLPRPIPREEAGDETEEEEDAVLDAS